VTDVQVQTRCPHGNPQQALYRNASTRWEWETLEAGHCPDDCPDAEKEG
jgi:hypothetical protein